MTSLFLLGNINQYTFANAALAAHVRDRDNGGTGLTHVLVLHSPESQKHLSSTDDWQRHLASHGLSSEIFVNCMVNLHRGGDEQLSRIAQHVEGFLLSLDSRRDVYVDLTNGSSLYKSVLSNVAYVLDVPHPFILDTPRREEFLKPAELKQIFVELPAPALLDSVAPAWLTEVRRFNTSAHEAACTLSKISGASDAIRQGFEGDIRNAVREWFNGAKHRDGAALGGAVRHVGRAFEDLVQGVYEAMAPDNKRPKTLFDMLGQVCSGLSKWAPHYEPQLLDDIAQFIRRLRNASTHEQTSPDLGRIRARLSTELLLATSEYFRLLNENGLITPAQLPDRATEQCVVDGKPGDRYFFGLDGDDTGRELERLFQGVSDEKLLSRFSAAIDSAMRAVSKKIKLAPISGKVLFMSGDDVLFKGSYDTHAIGELRSTYSRLSGGHTCSIGFGRSLKEAFIAMKVAKAAPGKDSVVGYSFCRSKASQRSSSRLQRVRG